jgi:hypothetical protein
MSNMELLQWEMTIFWLECGWDWFSKCQLRLAADKWGCFVLEQRRMKVERKIEGWEWVRVRANIMAAGRCCKPTARASSSSRSRSRAWSESFWMNVCECELTNEDKDRHSHSHCFYDRHWNGNGMRGRTVSWSYGVIWSKRGKSNFSQILFVGVPSGP